MAFQIHEDVKNQINGQLKKTKVFDSNVGIPKNKPTKLALQVRQPQPSCSNQTKKIKIEKENVHLNQNAKIHKNVLAKEDKIEPILPVLPARPVIAPNLSTLNNPFEKRPKKERDNFPMSLLYSNEYREDIWKYLTQLELSAPKTRVDFMTKQADLSWETRSILVDWLVSVADEYDLCNQTIHLSVNYIDLFLSRISVVRNKFQLVGAAAMLLAGKMEEIYPVEPKEWSYLTGDAFTTRQVIKMEQLILKVLKFRMQSPTIYNFIQQICVENKVDDKTMHLAMYLSELVLLEGKDYLQQLPSKLAASSIALARHTLDQPDAWTVELEQSSGYSFKQLSPVVQRQHKTFEESPLKKHTAIRKKYQSPKYNRVALLRPKILHLDFEDVDDTDAKESDESSSSC